MASHHAEKSFTHLVFFSSYPFDAKNSKIETASTGKYC